MSNAIWLVFAILLSTPGLAETTSPIVIAGSAVNEWLQGGLRVTDKPFDLGIQGRGFFVLKTASGELVFSRYGEMSLSSEGNLVHNPSQNVVMGFCGSEIEPINLSRFTRDSDGSLLKSFRVELNGSIVAIYENGYVHKTCSLALAIFRDSPKLDRKQHILRSTDASGDAAIGTPEHEGRGSIYSSTLEELDEQLYRLNGRVETNDKVLDEMRKAQVAMEQWNKQKTLFYIFDLKITRSDLEKLEAAQARSGEKIQNAVKAVQQGSASTSQEEYEKRIKDALDEEEAVFVEIVGLEGLRRAIEFRAAFNRDLFTNFGTRMNITGF